MISAENGDGDQEYGEANAAAMLPWHSVAGDMLAAPPPAPNAVVSTYISFAQLLESAVHGMYQHLHILGDLLPRKNDSERKVAIAQFALRTRMLCIRLLAVLDWVNLNGTQVDRCAHIVNILGKQGVQLIDSADKLAEISRTTLPTVCLPPFSVYQAVSILVNPVDGLRLPTCIREKFASKNPLTDDEKLFVIRQLNQLIETRLVALEIPPRLLKNLKVAEGCLHLKVENEFEARLTLMSFDSNCPWRLLDLAIVVRDKSAPGSDVVLVHRRQLDFICQFVQARLLAIEDSDNSQPLVVLYDMLHSFCLSLQLELLHDHSNQLVRMRYTDAIEVSRQSQQRFLTLTYWQVPLASTGQPSASSAQAKQVFLLTVAANDAKSYLTVDHVPAVSNAPKFVKPSRQSMYWLLTKTLFCRAQTMLERLMLSIEAADDPEGLIGGGGSVSMEKAITNGNALRPVLRMDLLSPSGPTDQIVEVSLDARKGTLRCTNPSLPRQVLVDFDASVRHFTFPPPPSTSISTPGTLPGSFFSSLLQARTIIMLNRLMSSARRLGHPARIASHYSTVPISTEQVVEESAPSAEHTTQQALWVSVGIPSVRLSAAFTCSVTSSKVGLADICLHQLDSLGHEDSIAKLPEWFAINDRRVPSNSGYVCSRLNLDAVLASTYSTLSTQRETLSSSTDLILAHRQLVVSMSFCQQRTALVSLEASLKKMGFQTAGVSVDWSNGQQSLLLTGVTPAGASFLSPALENRLVHCRIIWELPRNERWFVSAILMSDVDVPPATLSTPANTVASVKACRLFPFTFNLEPISASTGQAFDRTANFISYTLDSSAHLLSLLTPLGATDKASNIQALETQSQRASVTIRYNCRSADSKVTSYQVTISAARKSVPSNTPSGPSAIVSWHYSMVFGPGSPHASLRQIYLSWFSRTLDIVGLLLMLEDTAPAMACLRSLTASSPLVSLPVQMDSRQLATFLGGAPQNRTGGMSVPAAAMVPMSPVSLRLIYHGCLAFIVRLIPDGFIQLQHCPRGIPNPLTQDSATSSEQPRALSLPPGYVTKIISALTAEADSRSIVSLTRLEEEARLSSRTGSVVMAAERFDRVISSGRLELMLTNAIAYHSLEVALNEPNASATISMGALSFTSRRAASPPPGSGETPPLMLVNPVVQITVSLCLGEMSVFKILSSPPEPDSVVPSSPSGGLPPLFPGDCSVIDQYVARDAQQSSDLSSSASTTRLMSLLRFLSQQLPIIRDFLSLMALALNPEASAACRFWLPLTGGPSGKAPVTCQNRSKIHFAIDLYRNEENIANQNSLPTWQGPLRLLAVFDNSSQAFMVHLTNEQQQSHQPNANMSALSEQLNTLQQRATQQASMNKQTPLYPVLSEIAANMRL